MSDALTEEEYFEAVRNFSDLFLDLYKPPETITVSEYAENERVMPLGTPFPGHWQNSKTPYLREIQDNFSVTSPIQKTVFMKATQLGATAAAENIIMYWIGIIPAHILFFSATEDLLKKWMIKRLEPAIDSYNLRDRIFAQIDNSKTRRSGDTTFSKEFIGGSLVLASAQSPASLRSDSIRILIGDELDGAPFQVRTGEGNFISIASERTTAWGSRKKIFFISTPTISGSSAIENEYKAADQRKFYIPCPHCGKYQFLEFGNENTIYGLKAEMDHDVLIDAYYVCKHCEAKIYNHDKTKFLSQGEWRPTSKSYSSEVRSYHLNSLYSPIGMASFKDVMQAYLTAQETDDGMRSFVNLKLGDAYEEKGTKPKIEKVIELRCNYKSGTVPEGVLYLTAAIDVQRGSENNDKYPQRLEIEILGHGSKFRTWSIQHLKFNGDISNCYDGAWQDLYEYFINDDNFMFRRHDGILFAPKLIFIDAKDGNYTPAVYGFCDRFDSIYPVMGFSVLKQRKKEKKDLLLQSQTKRYRRTEINKNLYMYQFNGKYYKTRTYRNLKVPKSEIPPEKAGFCGFPIDYPEEYFKQLTAEELLNDGSFHLPAGRHNEALDLHIMNLCAGDVYLDKLFFFYRADAQARGIPKNQIELITHASILEQLEKEMEKNSISQTKDKQ